MAVHAIRHAKYQAALAIMDTLVGLPQLLTNYEGCLQEKGCRQHPLLHCWQSGGCGSLRCHTRPSLSQTRPCPRLAVADRRVAPVKNLVVRFLSFRKRTWQLGS